MSEGLWNAGVGSIIGVLSWLLWSMNYEKRMAPDSYQYSAMAQGKKVPNPFWGRWLMPLLLRERGALWEAMTLVSVVAMHGLLAYGFGIRAALLLAPSHLIAFNVKIPVLVDLPALALVCAALVVEDHNALIAIGLVAGSIKQNAPIMAAIAAWSPWPLVGLLMPWVGLAWSRKLDPAVDKNPWLLDPLGTTLASKRFLWANPTIMLFPWGLVLALALHAGDLRLLAALILGYAPLFLASDNARLYLWALPIAITYAVKAPVPEVWWGAVLLVNAIVSVYATEVTSYTKGRMQVT